MLKKSNNFKENVKKVVKRIPAGKTLSYKEVALASGNGAAARAVAKMMAGNFDLEVPCHRVILSNGKLGGYNRGGTEEKKRMLDLEKLIQKTAKSSLK